MPPTLRIALVTPFADNLSETFIAAHISGLDRVVSVLTGGTLPLRVEGGVAFLRSGGLGRVLDRIAALPVGGSLDALLRRRITRYLERAGIGVVLAEFGPTGDRMLPCCRAAGIPLVVHFHGFDAYRTAIVQAHGAYRALLAGCAAIVVPSAHMADALVALGAERGRLHIIPNGADIERFAPNGKKRRPGHFLAIGRMVEKKGLPVLLRAFHRLRRRQPQVRLQLVGDGPLRGEVERLLDKLALRDAVELSGALPHAVAAQAMRGAWALVQASRRAADGDAEGLPVTVLEAMAAGLPVVASRHTGIPEALRDGQDGLLVPEGNADALAEAMERLLTEPGLAERLGASGRARAVASFDRRARIAELQRVLERAAGR